MLAATFGVVMNLWACGTSPKFGDSLSTLAKKLFNEMFLSDSIHKTTHTLMRGYAQGIIELALVIDPTLISLRKKKYLRSPFNANPDNPFEGLPNTSIGAEEAIQAMRMDFANYTLGRLISDRDNHDLTHPEYVQVRDLIAQRMMTLGYRSAVFDEVDKRIAERRSCSSDTWNVDRYGKKYSWISFLKCMVFGRTKANSRKNLYQSALLIVT